MRIDAFPHLIPRGADGRLVERFAVLPESFSAQWGNPTSHRARLDRDLSEQLLPASFSRDLARQGLASRADAPNPFDGVTAGVRQPADSVVAVTVRILPLSDGALGILAC